MNTTAALHNPDAVAGGNVDKISGLGDSKINSSLGSQWKTRAESIEQQVKQQYVIQPKTIDDIPNDAMMNINLGAVLDN